MNRNKFCFLIFLIKCIEKISKAFPKSINSDARKRPATISSEALSGSGVNKKSKPQPIPMTSSKPTTSLIKTDPTPTSSTMISESSTSGVVKTDTKLQTLDDVADDLTLKLNQKENVTDLVIVTMAFLPEQIPPVFQSSYKAISNPGTTAQIKDLAKLMAQQFSEAGIVNVLPSSTSSGGASTTKTMDTSKIAAETIDDFDQDDDADNDEMSNVSPRKLSLDVSQRGDKFESDKKARSEKQPANLVEKIKPTNIESIVSKKSSNKVFKLNEVTVNHIDQFNPASLQTLLNQANQRILNAEGRIFCFVFVLMTFSLEKLILILVGLRCYTKSMQRSYIDT